MPYKHRDHLLSRKIICARCGKKNLKCSMLEPGTQFLNLVQMYANSNYNPDLLSSPTGLCSSCKVYLYSAKKGESLSIVTLENWLLTSERIRLLPRFKVVDKCFGMKLHEGYAGAIAMYVKKLKETEIYVKVNFNHNLSMGWKGHIIEHHLVIFLNNIRMPLGIC
nr:uncharacterized protein LOC124807737 isoform X2 [Hydra vulgaris]